MSLWSAEIDFLVRKLGMGAANAVRAIRSAVDDDPYEILAYRGYGNGIQASVYGRVVERLGVSPSTDTDSVFRNLLNTYRRADSDPLPRAPITLSFGDSTTAMTTDSQGYFGGWVRPERADTSKEWHEFKVVLGLSAESGENVESTGEILLPAASAKFGVISDIDDTVIQSRVSNFIQAARTVMLGNARTRLPFPGVAAFYRALRRGATGEENNPVFYVSSSPWNIYDVIAEFMVLQDIPKGPLLLRDWDLRLNSLRRSRHFEHKGVAIRNVMQLYPHLEFVLIGDTSQHDPEIYARIVSEFPERVRAIYIRDVTSDARRSAAVKKLAAEVADASATLVLSDTTLGAATHAFEHGLVAEDAIPEIRDEKGVPNHS